MSTTQPCHSPTPEPRPYPRHPAPWRQTEATLYERINDVTLPDVVESARSYLVVAPPDADTGTLFPTRRCIHQTPAPSAGSSCLRTGLAM
ncbi:hypothetical protein FOVSG1_006318 [Fusarium oxysporum f. sp. vasinfectum]